MKKTKQEIEDIYQSSDDQAEPPSAAAPQRKEMEREIFRYNMRSVVWGVLFALLTVGVVWVIALFDKPTKAPPETPPSTERPYVYKYSLSLKDSWVLEYARVADKSFSEKLESFPLSTKWVKNAAYHVIMGQQAMRQKADSGAISHFTRALELFPTMKGVHGELGTAYLREGLIDPAIEHLEKGVKEKNAPVLLNNLGVAMMQSDAPSLAEKPLLQALEMQPNNPGIHKNLALVYEKTDAPKKAIQHFKSYLVLNPDDALSVEQFMVYLQEQDQPQEAISFLEDHCEKHPETTRPLYLLLAKMKAQALDADGAVAALNKMRALLSPNLLLVETNDPDFDPIREKEVFSDFINDLEIKSVVLQESSL